MTFRYLLAAAAVVAILPATAQASVSINTTYYFSGTCTDCQGTAKAELTLSNYTPGTPISNHFLSFHYDGTDLIPGGFTITLANDNVVSGVIQLPLGAEQVEIGGVVNGIDYDFKSGTDGRWSVTSSSVLADYGTGGTYSATAGAVPEAATWAMMMLGMGIVGFAMRRQNVRAQVNLG